MSKLFEKLMEGNPIRQERFYAPYLKKHKYKFASLRLESIHIGPVPGEEGSEGASWAREVRYGTLEAHVHTKSQR
jgi:hypothetical protein